MDVSTIQEAQDSLNMLRQICCEIVKDYIFEIDPQDKRSSTILSTVGEMIYVMCKIDSNFLEDLRKYWKNDKKIDYRCVLEIKDIYLLVLSPKYTFNIYWVKNDIDILMLLVVQSRFAEQADKSLDAIPNPRSWYIKVAHRKWGGVI